MGAVAPSLCCQSRPASCPPSLSPSSIRRQEIRPPSLFAARGARPSAAWIRRLVVRRQGCSSPGSAAARADLPHLSAVRRLDPPPGCPRQGCSPPPGLSAPGVSVVRANPRGRAPSAARGSAPGAGLPLLPGAVRQGRISISACAVLLPVTSSADPRLLSLHAGLQIRCSHRKSAPTADLRRRCSQVFGLRFPILLDFDSIQYGDKCYCGQYHS